MSTFHEWLVSNGMDAINAALVLFVFVFIFLSKSPLAAVAVSFSYLIGNTHGKKETFYSGYLEGMKEGLKHGSRRDNEMKM